ncbi:MAG TPA: hypothetical protein VK186_27220, partial [Candidatus Deferrimicrobium sp.]|nr:hypothetical protein [Candidatus Deferrimicrobium sp.]
IHSFQENKNTRQLNGLSKLRRLPLQEIEWVQGILLKVSAAAFLSPHANTNIKYEKYQLLSLRLSTYPPGIFKFFGAGPRFGCFDSTFLLRFTFLVDF